VAPTQPSIEHHHHLPPLSQYAAAAAANFSVKRCVELAGIRDNSAHFESKSSDLVTNMTN